MKRDMDLIRHLLIYLEEKPDPSFVKVEDILIEGFVAGEVQYHLNLMFQAGLVNGEPARSQTSDRLISVLPFDLTWQGHEFLEAVRDPEIWRQAKTGASKAGTAGIDFIWALAKALITNAIRDRTGLSIS